MTHKPPRIHGCILVQQERVSFSNFFRTFVELYYLAIDLGYADAIDDLEAASLKLLPIGDPIIMYPDVDKHTENCQRYLFLLVGFHF